MTTQIELTNEEILALLTLPIRDAVNQAQYSAQALEQDRLAVAS